MTNLTPLRIVGRVKVVFVADPPVRSSLNLVLWVYGSEAALCRETAADERRAAAAGPVRTRRERSDRTRSLSGD